MSLVAAFCQHVASNFLYYCQWLFIETHLLVSKDLDMHAHQCASTCTTINPNNNQYSTFIKIGQEVIGRVMYVLRLWSWTVKHRHTNDTSFALFIAPPGSFLLVSSILVCKKTTLKWNSWSILWRVCVWTRCVEQRSAGDHCGGYVCAVEVSCTRSGQVCPGADQDPAHCGGPGSHGTVPQANCKSALVLAMGTA